MLIMFCHQRQSYATLIIVTLNVLLSVGDADKSVCSDPVTINVAEGEISSPYFPYFSSPNATCVWKFNISDAKQQVVVTFTDFFIDADDVFSVHVGNTPLNFTRNRASFSVIVTPQNSSISLKTSANATIKRHFSATFSSSNCQLSTSSNMYHSVLMSPFYLPSNDPKEKPLTCTWVLMPPAKQVASISFIESHLSKSTVNIYDGASSSAPRLAAYTGDKFQPDVIGTALHITVEFVLQINEPGISFKAEYYSLSSSCAKFENVSERSFSIVPPQNSLGATQRCVWILQGVDGMIFSLDIEPELKNPNDFLMINDGPSRYSMNIANFGYDKHGSSNTVTSSNKLYIYYATSVTKRASTFKILARSQISGGHHESNGSFSLPKMVSENDSVIFNLEADINKQVEVTILSKLISKNELYFYEYVDHVRHDIAKFNSTFPIPMYPVFSTSSRLIIEAKSFTQKDVLNGTFKSIEPGCDKFSDSVLGSYELSKDHFGNCAWLVRPKDSKNRTISIIFNNLSLENGTVTIYRGLAASPDRKLVTFNNLLRYLPNIHIDGNDGARIETSSLKPPSNEKKGNYLSAFYGVISGCVVRHDLKSGNLTLRSPGYPTRYPLNANCSWEINIPQNKSLLLNFVDVDIYLSDIFNIYSRNGSKVGALLFNATGASSVNTVIVNDNITFVWWSLISNLDTLPVRGFSMDLLVLDAGRNITEDEGTLNIPGKDVLHVNQSFEAFWKIEYPVPPKSDKAYNVQFSYKITNPSSNSGFAIYDGGSLSSDIFPTNESSLLSRSNAILIRYNVSKVTGEAETIELHFKKQECEKKDQCENIRICLHKDWKCNGVNNCGDWSDEKDCNSSITINEGVSRTLFGLGIFFSLIAGIALTLVAPIAYRKIRSYRQRYNDFHTLAEE